MNHILTLSDETTPFGSPFVDSVRTAVTEETTDALQIVFLLPSMTIEESQKILESMGAMFTQIHGGDATSTLLIKDQNEWRI